MSKDSLRPKNVRFVELGSAGEPNWMGALRGHPLPQDLYDDVAPLTPPEMPSHVRPAFAPILESVRPPPLSAPPPHFSRSLLPSQASSVNPPPGSQYPGPADDVHGSEPAPFAAPRDRRPDTFVEDLVPRAEEEAVLAISEAIERFAAERARALEAAEREVLNLVRVICRRVLLHEITVRPSVLEKLVQEGLEALGKGDRVTVRLGPFFAETRAHIQSELQGKGVDCVVVVDPAVGAHGCQLETQFGRVDESVETRLGVLLRGFDVAS